MPRSYQNLFFTSIDGIKLYARDYSAKTESDIAVVCLHGLTRNSADFSNFCQQLSDDFRIIVPDQRGRGLSANDSNPDNYQLATYIQDTLQLIEQLHLDKVIVIGASMGGLMAMLMMSVTPERIAGIVFNDIGPDIETDGLNRIKKYAGSAPLVNNWQDAVDYVRELNADVFPHYQEYQWRNFAENIFTEKSNGQLVLSFDENIMKPILESDTTAAPVDLWPAFISTGKVPCLLIRGQNSDILSAKTAQEMCRQHPQLDYFEVPNIGHAPMLTEVGAFRVIESFFKKVTSV